MGYAYPSATTTQTIDIGGRVWTFTYAGSSDGGNLTAVKRPGASSNSVSLTYSPALSSVTIEGVSTSYNRTVSGTTATTTVTNAISGVRTAITDLNKSRITQVTDELNRVTNYAYDASARPTDITMTEGNKIITGYDGRGNVTSTKLRAKSGSGLADIVTTTDFAASCTNPVVCNKPNWSRDAKSNQTDYTYDAGHAGLLTVTAPAATSGGVRPQTRFGYDGTNLIAEYNGSNGLLRQYVHGPGNDEPLVWYEGSGLTDRRWLHGDERGSVIAVSNGSGSSNPINAYDEYGIPGSANSGRSQYTGQTWIPELGLYYYKARFYSPTLGSFMQTDPIGYADGINWYAYVGSDPVNGADPSGLGDDDKPVKCNENCPTIFTGGPNAGLGRSRLVGSTSDAVIRGPGGALGYYATSDGGKTASWVSLSADVASMSIGGVRGSGAVSGGGGFSLGSVTLATPSAGEISAAIILSTASVLATTSANISTLLLSGDTPREQESNSFVVRGGWASPSTLIAGTGPVRSPYSGLYGFSVSTAPNMSVRQIALTSRYPHDFISFTTMSQLKGIGYNVSPTPFVHMPIHATIITGGPLNAANAGRISSIFTPIRNPGKP